MRFRECTGDSCVNRCVWYVSKYVSPPGKGTVGGRGYLLMRELARLGERVVIITSDSNQLTQVPEMERPYLRETVDGMDFWWVRTLKYRVAKSMLRILSWLHFEWRLLRMPKKDLPKPDVIIVSSLSLLTILNGFLLRRKYGCRLVFEIRDIWPLTITEEGGFSERNPLVRLLALVERAGYRHADAIVGTMPNLDEHVARILGHERDVACIPMGFDEDVASNTTPLPDEYRRAFIPPDKCVVAHVGSMGITNALDTLLECASRLKDRRDIHFLLVGDGELREHYQQRYGHLRNVSFGDRVPREMVQSVLHESDVLYFSTHVSEVWRYGQSLNKVIDYMLSGRPVLASYTGFPSMINEAGCGCFVPSGDVDALEKEIVRLAGMGAENRDEMGRRGRDWILANRNYRVLARDYHALLFPESTSGGDGAGPA